MKSLKLRALVLAAGLVAASLSTSASATGSMTLTSPGHYEFTGTTDLPGNSFNDFLGSFTASDFSSSASVTASLGGLVTLEKFELVNAATHVAVALGSIVGNFGSFSFAHQEGSTPLDIYSIHIKGTSTIGAGYSGNLTVAPVSAVPEPETYGMMLAGLGLMGFMARRRKSA